MIERPLLLVDVDGVLNPLGRPTPDFRKYECHVEGQTYTVFLNSRHGTRLLSLAVETGSELVWATTWEHWANEWIAPRLSLPQLPVIKLPPNVRGQFGEMFKTPAIAEYVGRRPFVWFDDQVWAADEDYLRAHPGVGDFLLVQVDPRVGLTQTEFGYAREWLRRLP
ncbi:HAD domain-containing protein [Sinosporangium siamense]|nr:HAD domain-containing protein [Sinosporangium siamense]